MSEKDMEMECGGGGGGCTGPHIHHHVAGG